jgi:hypothetical protein
MSRVYFGSLLGYSGPKLRGVEGDAVVNNEFGGKYRDGISEFACRKWDITKSQGQPDSATRFEVDGLCILAIAVDSPRCNCPADT